VYFPEIGWIEFEPTASQPEIKRIPSKTDLSSMPIADTTASRLLSRFRLIKTIYWLSPLAVILFGLIFYFALLERWLYLRLAPNIAIEKIYRRLYHVGRPLAGERTRAETAYEFHQKLVRKIHAVGEHSRFAKFFMDARQEIESLTSVYQDTLFSDNNIKKKDVRKALNTWKRLRLRLLITRTYGVATSSATAPRRSNLIISNRRRLHGERSR
jgi:hypothetical protein